MHAGDLIGGRYRLAEKLGEGAFGVVWRADEVYRDQLISSVAVKAFTAQVDVRELQILATCDYASILRYRSIVEHREPTGQNLVCLVTELAEGGDVAAMLQGFRKGLPAAQVERIILQIADALTYLHGRDPPIVHRDIKPQNMLVVGPSIKLADVGTARALEGGGRDTSRGLGSLAYTAPERFDRKIGPESDVYSLAVSAHELLTNQWVYSSKDVARLSDVEIMRHHLESEPGIPKNLPDHWQELLRCCLAKDPGQRWDANKVVWFLRDRPVEEERKRLEETAREVEGLRRDRNRLTTELARTRKKTIQDLEDLHDTLQQAQQKAEADQQTRQRLEQENRRLEDELETTRRSLALSDIPPTLDLSQLRGETSRPLSERWNRAEGWRKWAVLGVTAAASLLVGLPLGSMLSGRGGDEQPTTPVPSLSARPEPVQQAPEPLAAPPSEPSPPEPDPGPPPLNRWVRVEPPTTPIRLGLPSGSSADYGFSAEANIFSPTGPYEIQQHEVTWQEIASWLQRNRETHLERPSEDTDDHPVRGILWDTARAYCTVQGGDLPTEEQWEYAARGSELRPYPWGDARPSNLRTHVWRPSVPPSPVMTNEQDATPGDAAHALYDLAGNVREWTASLYRLNTPGTAADVAWVTFGGRTFRALRGLPPNEPLQPPPPQVGSALRSVLCATGPCTSNPREAREYQRALEYIGFRCAR